MLLAGKICIVVGVSSERGIGFATSKLFYDHGATVVVVDIQVDDDRVEALNRAISGERGDATRIAGYRCDITDRCACQGVVQSVLDNSGRIDCLVNCAGIVKGQLANPQSVRYEYRVTPANADVADPACKAFREILKFCAKQPDGFVRCVSASPPG
jgi:NAD(P)-dependent dehydrogenase (short-subunit alcohol dehydrogenase family)